MDDPLRRTVKIPKIEKPVTGNPARENEGAVAPPVAMVEARAPRPAPSARPAEEAPAGKTLLRIAWLAVLLGFAIEGLILLATGTDLLLRVRPLLADLTQKVSWSVLVCLGLAAGKEAAKVLHAPLMAFAGLLFAPLSFVTSRALQNGVAYVISLPASIPPQPSPTVVALLKGIEYGFLGLLLTWVGSKALTRGRKALAYSMSGFIVGLVFGGMILVMVYSSAPQPPALTAMLARGINEVFHPVGCAMVLFAAGAIGRGVLTMNKDTNKRATA
ncbi:MAG TPA: hypothetical protein VFD58_27845 [Blastocatellia bacterium]|nr:hypothetical protein [Blastocatellia bacterium]